MVEKFIKIIGLILGAAIAAVSAGLLIKEKNDPESKKIYGIMTAVGAVVFVACLILMFI